MSSIGPTELIVVAVIALLVLGPRRLPEAGRGLGRGLREFKTAITTHDHDRSAGSSTDEPAPALTTETAR